jgi:hypothetical protein
MRTFAEAYPAFGAIVQTLPVHLPLTDNMQQTALSAQIQ